MARAVAGFVAVALIVACTRLQQNQPSAHGELPIRLTNEQFWGMVDQYSEAGGDFPSDNFTSNEISVGALSGELALTGRTGGAYVGVGPEQNFTYIAAVRPEVAFVVDIRRQAMIQHLMYKALFELSRSRTEFISRLFSKPLQPHFDVSSTITEMWDGYLGIASDSTLFLRNLADIKRHLLRTRGGGWALSEDDMDELTYVFGAFFRLGPTISYGGYSHEDYPERSVAVPTFVSLTTVSDSLGVPRSFLGTEEAFLFVRNLQDRNLIVPIVGDFAGTHALPSVAAWLRAHGALVRTFYVSNVEQYLFKPSDAWKQFYANVELFPLAQSSVFIRPVQGVLPGSGHRGRSHLNPMVMPSVTIDGGLISGPRLDPSGVSPHQRSPALCSIPEFLAAYQLNQINTYADAVRCLR
jgi:hypothetical protein